MGRRKRLHAQPGILEQFYCGLAKISVVID